MCTVRRPGRSAMGCSLPMVGLAQFIIMPSLVLFIKPPHTMTTLAAAMGRWPCWQLRGWRHKARNDGTRRLLPKQKSDNIGPSLQRRKEYITCGKTDAENICLIAESKSVHGKVLDVYVASLQDSVTRTTLVKSGRLVGSLGSNMVEYAVGKSKWANTGFRASI